MNLPNKPPISVSEQSTLRNRFSTNRFARILFCWIGLTASTFELQCLGTEVETTKSRTSPWINSRVKGSPEPPLPYTTHRIFQNVDLDRPTEITWLPTAQKWIANHSGNQIVSFGNDKISATTQPLLNLQDCFGERIQTGYATTFHHDIKKQPWCFLTLTTKRKTEDGHCLAKVKVIDPSIPTFDPSTFQILLRWKSNGHVGSSMQFGSDGMLYLSVGDGQPPYPPDGDGTGQDLNDLRASILRIDVNQDNKQAYRIPPDNPFVNQKDARGEVWAYGFRNPWKMTFVPGTNDLLVADVGWEMREMIHLVRKGQNHGWSIMEGSQPVKPDEHPLIPITPPLFEHTHLDSRSITGGHIWQSDRIPSLKGAYLYGDWMTGKVWGLRFEGNRVTWHQELVDTSQRIICFMLDPSGEVFIVGYDGSIHQLQPNPQVGERTEFPAKLSETGIFTQTETLTPSDGVVEYEINSHHWADGTRSRQWIGLPGTTQLRLFEQSDWKTGESKGRFIFPKDTVAVKTVSYLSDAQDPNSVRHLETQLLHKTDKEWKAYNYIWNDQQTDATLQEDRGIDRQIVVRDLLAENGQRIQNWHHASRSECLLCHIWSSGTVQGFWPPQLSLENGDRNQLDKLTDLGIFAAPIPKQPALVSPIDDGASIEARARSYLATNCSTCHRKLGGGTATFTFDIEIPLLESEYIDAMPSQGTFGIEKARVVAPGMPSRSVLLYRTLKSGRGHMPQFGSSLVDPLGVRLLHDWIDSMSPSPGDENLPNPYPHFAKLSELSDAELETMLSTIEGSIALSLACHTDAVSQSTRERIIHQGASRPHAPVRDLFEHFLSRDKRPTRLGHTIDETELLALKGSRSRGEQLFQMAPDISCRNCHRIGNTGRSIGPDLSSIGTLQTPSEILASILRPSENIAPEYLAKQILQFDGTILTGIVAEETKEFVSLVVASGETLKLPIDSIENMRHSQVSAMPNQLFTGMKMQDAADLLAFLSSQKTPTPLQHKQAQVHHTTGKITIDGRSDESDWATASRLEDFVFTWWKDGDPPQQQTDARLLWDDSYLYVCFVCSDSDIRASRTGRDSKVYRDDCVEIFASPEFQNPENYFNLEMNALGEQLDQYRPQGKLQRNWNPDGIQIAVTIDGTINEPSDTDRRWTLEAAIPFSLFRDVLPKAKPQKGDRWRLNLSRLEDEMVSKSQWSQGDRNYPRFHHPEYFGTVEFVDPPKGKAAQ